MNPVLSFRNLEKEFKVGLRLRHVHAVKGVTFEVMPGEIFGYLGPNGAGKTTTMKMAMGLIRPTRGTVSLFGGSIEDTAIRRRVGYLPEQPYFYDYLTAWEILDFYARLYEIPKAERRRRIGLLLERVGLEKAGHRRLRGYSKGMLQRVGLAQALLPDPDLVVFDEPQSGLDPMGRKEVRDLIVSLRAEGKTVFFSTHILHDIESICDRVGLLIGGRLEKLGSLDELLSGGKAEVDVVAADVPPEVAAALESRGAETRDLGRSRSFRVAEADLGEVLRLLADAKARITHVTPHRRSLEDVFMKEAEARRVA